VKQWAHESALKKSLGKVDRDSFPQGVSLRAVDRRAGEAKHWGPKRVGLVQKSGELLPRHRNAKGKPNAFTEKPRRLSRELGKKGKYLGVGDCGGLRIGGQKIDERPPGRKWGLRFAHGKRGSRRDGAAMGLQGLGKVSRLRFPKKKPEGRVQLSGLELQPLPSCIRKTLNVAGKKGKSLISQKANRWPV